MNLQTQVPAIATGSSIGFHFRFLKTIGVLKGFFSMSIHSFSFQNTLLVRKNRGLLQSKGGLIDVKGFCIARVSCQSKGAPLLLRVESLILRVVLV